ncbi:MAG TPA: transporter substrate-binding domain-containing protein [Burkholderiales bacterium]|nr:transporter substrate-binding domain-containing protein [Burkholderiales bacterium]
MTKHLLRVALFLPMYARDPVTSELRAFGAGAVFMDIARSLAARMGVEILLMGYEVPREVVECLKTGACDIVFMGAERARAVGVDFSPPVVHLDYSCLVPAGSPIKSIADADRQGVRIAVVRNHASTLALSRVLTHAEQIGAEVPDAAFDLLRTGGADALASVRPALIEYSAKLPGSGVLEGRYGFNPMVIAIAKGQAGRLASISEFVEEAKASGLVQRAIARAEANGIHVAPAGNPDNQQELAIRP